MIKVVSEMELRDEMRTQHDEQKHELTHHRSTMGNSQHKVQDLEQFHHTSLWLRIMIGGVFLDLLRILLMIILCLYG